MGPFLFILYDAAVAFCDPLYQMLSPWGRNDADNNLERTLLVAAGLLCFLGRD